MFQTCLLVAFFYEIRTTARRSRLTGAGKRVWLPIPQVLPAPMHLLTGRGISDTVNDEIKVENIYRPRHILILEIELKIARQDRLDPEWEWWPEWRDSQKRPVNLWNL